MRAVIFEIPGGPDVLKVTEWQRPRPDRNQVN